MTSIPSAPTNGRTINNNDDLSKAPINEPITLTSGTTQQIPSHLAPASLRVSITSFALGILFGSTLYLSFYLFSFDSLKSAASNGWNLLGNDYDQEVIGNGFIKNVVGLVNQGKVDKDSHWVWKPFETPQFNFYLLSWSAFHMLEFVITARYNPTRLHVDSFLLQNGISYHLAHLLGITEFILETYYYPQIKNLTYFTYIGVIILLIGQFIRSLAMIHASGNFSHTVAWKKRGDHELVTDGIYSLTRHPSYLGFFYWALSTQILLSNPISFFVFIIVLWRFFNHRIRVEEEYLVEFFGKDYLDYRRRVGTLLPFIK